MENIGDKLKSAREARKLTIKEVTKDTKIIYKYIEALENDEFDKFPSDVYLMGFLRAYAEYLKLDPEEIIQAYKGYQLGESATPLEELTRPTRSPMSLTMLSLFNQYRNGFYIGGIVIAVLAVILLFSHIFSSVVSVDSDDSIKNIKSQYGSQKGDIENVRNLQLTNDSGFALVYVNEAVQFLVDNKEIMFVLKGLKAGRAYLDISPGNISQTIEIEKPKTLRIKDFPREVIFTLKGITEKRAKINVTLGEKQQVDKDETAKKDEVELKPGKDNTKVIAQNEKNLKIVFEADFLKQTYLELYIDGNKKRKGIVPEGTQERWEASEYIQLKIGNAGGIKARINGKEYSFGQAGQVANKVITWKKDISNPNLYHIVIKDW